MQRASALNSSKEFWSVINAPFLGDDNMMTTDIHVEEEAWIAHFEGVFSNTHDLISQLLFLLPSGLEDRIIFSLEETQLALSQCKCLKAPGPDGIPTNFFLDNEELWAPLLTNVFNKIVQLGVPSSWKKTDIIPIYKKGDKLIPQNYRPISLLDSTAKLMCRLLLNRLEDWAKDKNLIIQSQYGFRKGKGTVDQCLNLYLIIGKYTAAKNGHLYLAFMDLTSAFDCVAQSKLWLIMEAMGIETQIINVICDLYAGVTACVRFGKAGECTRHFRITRGVRQGCVRSPFLFALYTILRIRSVRFHYRYSLY